MRTNCLRLKIKVQRVRRFTAIKHTCCIYFSAGILVCRRGFPRFLHFLWPSRRRGHSPCPEGQRQPLCPSPISSRPCPPLPINSTSPSPSPLFLYAPCGTRLHVRTHARTHTHTHIHACTNTQTHTHIHKHTHTRRHENTHTYTRTHARTNTRTNMNCK